MVGPNDPSGAFSPSTLSGNIDGKPTQEIKQENVRRYGDWLVVVMSLVAAMGLLLVSLISSRFRNQRRFTTHVSATRTPSRASGKLRCTPVRL